MRSKIIFIVGSILIVGLYSGFRAVEVLKKDDLGSAPVIQIDENELTLSVEDSENALLNGVSASDNEDGDVTENIFIESISPFDQDGNRTVTYAVFDSDSQVSWASRTFKYSDYTPPKFSLSGPLMITLNEMSTDSFLEKINAFSSVDGNITSKISTNQNLENNGSSISLSVTDSTGTTAKLDLNIETSLNSLTANLDIVLSDYLIYVPIDTAIDPLNYVKDVSLNNASRTDLLEEITIDSNYQANTPGIYEIRYTINRANGDYGMTKLIVIVEG